ncbi:nitroreductase/quinone reductase family protein [Kineosporia babensis]
MRATMIRLAPRPWFVTFMRQVMVPVDRYLLARSKGRYSMGGTTGAGTLLLTTTGRRTGQPRTTPLFFKPHGDGVFAVVASNFGRPQPAAWAENLLAHPDAVVTFGNQVIPVRARMLKDAEHEEVWDFFVSEAPVYGNYLTNSSHSSFRTFALESSGESSGRPV